MLNYYDIDFYFVEFKYRIKKINYIQHAEDYVYNFFLSSFMSYAIIQISIFDLEITLCLNIDENVFFLDRKLLFQQQNYYGFVFNIKFITIIDVANMQVFNQYIESKILLSSNKISMPIKTFLINNL